MIQERLIEYEHNGTLLKAFWPMMTPLHQPDRLS